MLIFLDTEFTGLGQRWPRLISIGLVNEDGREFYAELPMESYHKNCSPWTTQNVLPLLNGGDCIMQPDVLRQRLSVWISEFGSVQIVTDAPNFDFAFLRSTLYHWPANIDPKPVWFDTRTAVESYESCFTPSSPRHHALHDAYALRQAWQSLETTE